MPPRTRRHTRDARTPWLLFMLCSALSLGILLPAAAGAQVSAPREDYWIADGPVLALARAGGKLFVGGNFDYLGPSTGRASLLDRTSGAPSASFARAYGDVQAVLADGVGGWFIAGSFASVSGVNHPWLARILPDGTLDGAWNPKPNNEVNRLALIGNTLYVSGSFSTINGQFRLFIAAIDAASGALLPWDPSPTGNVSTIEADGTTLYVSGPFDSIAGVARHRGAAFDGVSGTILPWDFPGSLPGSVRDMAFSDSLVYLGGDFASVAGSPRNGLAALRKSDGSLAPWAPSVRVASGSPQVLALAMVGNTLYAGGDFDSVGGVFHRSIAAIDPVTGGGLPWTQNAIGTEVNALHAWGGLLYVGFRGLITTPVTRSAVAALRLDDGSFDAFAPLVEEAAAVYCIAGDASRLLVGGNFSSVGGVLRRNLGVLDEATGVALPWNPRPRGIVEDIAVSVDSQTVFVVGPYDSIAGVRRRQASSFDVTSGNLLGWDPAAVSSNTEEVHLDGGDIYLAGQGAVAAVSSLGAIAWQPTVNNIVTGIAVAGDSVYLAGNFTTVQGQPRRGLAALSRSSGALLAWDPAGTGSTLRLEDIEVSGSTVYVAGTSMGTMGGAARTYIAAIDRFTAVATPFNPVIPVASGQSVLEILLDGGRLYAVGQYATGSNRDIAAFDLATSARLAWNPVSNDNWAEDIVKGGTCLYVGGSMRSYASNPDGTQGRYHVPNLTVFPLDLPAGVEDGGLVSGGAVPGGGEGTLPAILRPNAPNPFTGSTRVEFSLRSDAVARLSVFDVRGRRVAVLADGALAAGPHAVEWDGADREGHRVPRGVYFARLECGGTTSTIKMLRAR